ncbi:MAG: FKBP-type peptidyl-prolyl cis-trans isomerase [Gammaproteobacteria bacterium]|jgi:FKBP-type peptidyl-prolyl cis-trans isomerase|nr:FKBP-type peptidyl-prolyl cis-trans isomerase [Gammaproteobacteria bacterium]MDP6695387.1 FKBP-type peptidyl-prolyl cis-trans isomerase [Gammaproteobacteria bacterium]
MKLSVKDTIRILGTALISLFFLTACGQQGGAEMPTSDGSSQDAASEVITELQIIDVVEGDGEAATAGQDVVVHYTGWLYQPGAPENRGKKFDSSVDRGQPFIFPLGAGRVIRGWDEGVAGMQIGGKRVLIIPPDMGYGARGAGADIPPNATLVFEVDLLDLR